MTDWNITAHGTTYDYFSESPSELFWIDPKLHYNFWCSVLGGTSGSSSSPRTELREVYDFSRKGLNWSPFEGVHTLAGTVRVELAPSSQKVIIGQVHAHGASNPFLMLAWWNGELRIQARPTPNGELINLARIPCRLSDARKYQINVGNGEVVANLSGVVASCPIDQAWSAYPFYFKAGAYVIDHEGEWHEGGWVVYEELKVEHTL